MVKNQKTIDYLAKRPSANLLDKFVAGGVKVLLQGSESVIDIIRDPLKMMNRFAEYLSKDWAELLFKTFAAVTVGVVINVAGAGMVVAAGSIGLATTAAGLGYKLLKNDLDLEAVKKQLGVKTDAELMGYLFIEAVLTGAGAYYTMKLTTKKIPKFDLKNPETFRGTNYKDVESYLDDALNGYTKAPLRDGNGVRYFDGKGNSWQLNYGYSNPTDAVHGGAYLKTTVGSEKIHIPLTK